MFTKLLIFACAITSAYSQYINICNNRFEILQQQKSSLFSLSIKTFTFFPITLSEIFSIDDISKEEEENNNIYHNLIHNMSNSEKLEQLSKRLDIIQKYKISGVSKVFNTLVFFPIALPYVFNVDSLSKEENKIKNEMYELLKINK
jgi:hypothetical protein